MVDENDSHFTTTRSERGIYHPDQPKNHRKENEKGKGTRARDKKTSIIFLFCGLQTKKKVETRSQTLTTVFKNPARYIMQ